MEKVFEDIKKIFKSYRKKYDDLNVDVEYDAEVWASGLYFNLYPFQVELSKGERGRLYKRTPQNPRNKIRFFFRNNEIVRVEFYNSFGEICLEYFMEYDKKEVTVFGFYEKTLDRCYKINYDDNKTPISTICYNVRQDEEMMSSLLYEYSNGHVHRVIEKGFIIHNNGIPAIIDVKYAFIYNELNELMEIIGEMFNHKNGCIVKENVYKRKNNM